MILVFANTASLGGSAQMIWIFASTAAIGCVAVIIGTIEIWKEVSFSRNGPVNCRPRIAKPAAVLAVGMALMALAFYTFAAV
jgi:hypothetical protein